MDERSVARPARAANTPPASEQHQRFVDRAKREQRGIRLALKYLDRIGFSHRCGHYQVPGEDGRSTYTVVYSRQSESCECDDWDHYPDGPCEHVYAVAVVAARTKPCAGCGRCFRHGNLLEVQDSLRYFEGDLICRECARYSDAEVL